VNCATFLECFGWRAVAPGLAFLVSVALVLFWPGIRDHSAGSVSILGVSGWTAIAWIAGSLSGLALALVWQERSWFRYLIPLGAIAFGVLGLWPRRPVG